MTEPVHAILGASSSHRWMNCPGSLRLIAELPDYAQDRSSVYADHGTAAHDLGRRCLVEMLGGPTDGSAKFDAEDWVGHTIVVDRANGDCTWTAPGEAVPLGANAFPVDDDMAEAVQVYLDEAVEQMSRLPSSFVYVERQLDMKWLRPNMYGTADLVVHEAFGELVVTDYKHGAGVVVEVEWNTQAMYYGLAALRAAGGPGDVEKVTLVIVQPRARHRDGSVRRWTISAQQLWDWREDLAAAADKTAPPDAPVVAGSWCRFCPAKATCPAMRALVADRAKEVFSPVADEAALVVDASELADQLDAVGLIEAWCKSKKVLARSMLDRGLTVPRWKLVRKRANRRWVDETALVEKLKSRRGVKKADYTKEVLLSPAQMEKKKVIGKKCLKDFWEKPEGEVTLVPEVDKRDAVAPSAVAAFSGAEVDSKVPSEVSSVTTVDGPSFLA